MARRRAARPCGRRARADSIGQVGGGGCTAPVAPRGVHRRARQPRRRRSPARVRGGLLTPRPARQPQPSSPEPTHGGNRRARRGPRSTAFCARRPIGRTLGVHLATRPPAATSSPGTPRSALRSAGRPARGPARHASIAAPSDTGGSGGERLRNGVPDGSAKWTPSARPIGRIPPRPRHSPGLHAATSAAGVGDAGGPGGPGGAQNTGEATPVPPVRRRCPPAGGDRAGSGRPRRASGRAAPRDRRRWPRAAGRPR